MLFDVEILPLIIGTVFNISLGMLWYSGALFMKPWMEEAGITKQDMESSKGKMGKVYALTALFALITSYVIGFIILNMGIDTMLSAIVVAAIVWLGTSSPMIIKNWGFENRSIKLGIINQSYNLVVYIVVAILFVLF